MKRHHFFYSLWMKTMNRCLYFFSRRALALSLVLSLASAAILPTQAAAQVPGVREFPAEAKRGMLVVTSPPDVLINGTAERLSPGVRIRGVNNLLVMSASLAGKTVLVNYVREKQQGMIQEVWILTQAEADADEKRSGMEPVTNFTFDSMGDKPKTDDGKTPYNQLPGYPKP